MNRVRNGFPDLDISGLLQHLHNQRESATRLIENQNRLLASMLGKSAESVPVSRPTSQTTGTREVAAALATAQSPAPRRGTVVSLFDYAQRKKEKGSDESVPDFQIFDENDADALACCRERVDALLQQYGADDALAINRKHMAATIFLCREAEALFFVREHSGVLFVVCYAGPDDVYRDAVTELEHYAAHKDLQINFMVQEPRVEALKAAGFSTTPIGIWQRIDPISDFTLGGQKMRRLRYLVSKYGKGESPRTDEYRPGEDAVIDDEICSVMDKWVALKGTTPPYVPDVKERVRRGDIGLDHRFFLTWRGDVLDNVIVFSRDNMNDGYLMDLEFYGEDMPLGSTEFALCEIIKKFAEEGRRVVSLGLTMGTGLFEHENGSADVQNLFEQLKKAEYVNGDANAQYKNKYRPITVPVYLARPQDAGKAKLNDLLMLLGTG